MEPKGPKVVIVLLQYHQIEHTLECLDSLKNIQYSHFEVIVVDNGSTREELTTLKTAYPHIFILENHENLGFAEGNNRGIQWALSHSADFILLLNNDTVVHPHLLKAFVQAADCHPQAAVFGAKIYSYDLPTTLWHTGGGVQRKWLRCFHLGCGEDDLGKKWEKIQPAEYVCGCALFARASAVKKVGLLNPDYFLLWEEIDWCFRFRKSGFECLFVPEAKVWHKISMSFEGRNQGPLWHYYYFRNRLLFAKHHLKKSERLSFYLWQLPKEIKEICKKLFFSQTNPLVKKQHLAILQGTKDYFLKRLGKSGYLLKK